MSPDSPIGVFDSGVGGLSVLSALVRELPGERFLYFGDRANAPYGEKTHERIAEISLANSEMLLSLGAKALVVACNTATAASVELLRERFPDVPVIGIEPAVKPAFEAGCRTVLVLATPRTTSEERFTSLLERRSREYGGKAVGVPCPGLSELIEEDRADAGYFEKLFAGYADLSPDGIALGCTHYRFAVKQIRQASGGIPVFDGAEGTARRCRRLLEERKMLSVSGGGIEFIGDADGRILRFWEKKGKIND